MQKKKLKNQRMLIQKITIFSLLQDQAVDLNKEIKAISSRFAFCFFFSCVFIWGSGCVFWAYGFPEETSLLGEHLRFMWFVILILISTPEERGAYGG